MPTPEDIVKHYQNTPTIRVWTSGRYAANGYKALVVLGKCEHIGHSMENPREAVTDLLRKMPEKGVLYVVEDHTTDKSYDGAPTFLH